MRGSNIFNDLFTNETVEIRRKAAGKGRNNTLDAQRNKLLLLRYIYYGRYTQKRYDVIMETLELEFHLSQRRIQDIIQANAVLLRQHRSEFPTIQELRKNYPHLVW